MKLSALDIFMPKLLHLSGNKINSQDIEDQKVNEMITAEITAKKANINR